MLRTAPYDRLTPILLHRRDRARFLVRRHDPDRRPACHHAWREAHNDGHGYWILDWYDDPDFPLRTDARIFERGRARSDKHLGWSGSCRDSHSSRPHPAAGAMVVVSLFELIPLASKYGRMGSFAVGMGASVLVYLASHALFPHERHQIL